MSLDMVTVRAIGRYLFGSAELPLLTAGVIKDVSQIAGKILFSMLKVKNKDNI
jgi:hypothetical protein